MEERDWRVNQIMNSKGGFCAVDKTMLLEVLEEIWKRTDKKMEVTISHWTEDQVLLTRVNKKKEES